VTVDVGDADDTDGWVDRNDITEGTAGCYSGSANQASYAGTGRYYEAAAVITATVAGATAGSGFVLVQAFAPNTDLGA
jgi:hypothetical protein